MTTAVWPSQHLARRLNSFAFHRKHLSGPAAYAFTLIVTAVAALASIALIPSIYQTPFLVFSGSVLASIWFGGFRQGVLSILLAALFANYYLLPPHGQFSMSVAPLARTCYWIFVTVALSALVSRLRASEDRARRILSSIAEGFIIVDREWKMVYVNPAAAKFFGKARRDMAGRTFWEVVPEVQRRSIEQRLRWCADAKQSVDFEPHLQVPPKRARMRAYSFPEGVSIFIQDITASKRKEDELRSAVDRLSTAYKAAKMGVWEWNIQTGELYWSEEIPRIHAIPTNEFDGRLGSWIKTVHPDDAASLRARIREALLKKQDYHAEFRVIHPNGDVRWVGNHGKVILDAQGEPLRMAGITADITEHRKEEEAVRRSEKLSTVSRLVATMAHEINNPLEAVTNLVYLIRQNKSLDPDTQKLLQMADEELARVNHLARQTLGFYRDNSTPQALDVSRLMDDLLGLFSSRLISKKLRVEKEFENPGTVAAFKGELQQLFSNLLSNAIDASPTGGTLVLRVKDELLLGPHPVRRVRAEVEDFGPGIRSADQPRVFEPFFTTKPNLGTGLGLWLSKQIAEKNGGSIEFRTRSEGAKTGACFSVTLPAAAEPELQPSEAPEHGGVQIPVALSKETALRCRAIEH